MVQLGDAIRERVSNILSDGVESVSTDGVEINNSVTWPDGSTTTTSPTISFDRCIMNLSSSQTVADDTLTVLEFDSTVVDTANLSDPDNNGITIGSDHYDLAQLTVGVRSGFNPGWELMRQLRDGSEFSGAAAVRDDNSNITRRVFTHTSGWFPVEENETYTVDVRHQEGTSIDVSDDEQTFLSITVV